MPIEIEFPWGRQRFWGDERTYDCFIGGGGPQPLECALWALTLWAHKSVDGGRPVDDVIRDVLEGHENSAALGLAVSLALQKGHVSETTLPLVTCQRLWHADLHRQMRESGRNVDFFGLNLPGQMTPAQRDAIAYLEGRTFRKRSVRDLVYPFVFGSEALLRDKLNAALKSFPDALPYSYKEQEEEGDETSDLLETARIWSHLGDRENYKVQSVPDHPSAVVVSYDRPDTLPERVQRQTEESANALRDYAVVDWANKSMEAGKVDPTLDLSQALSFARTRDRDDLFASIETDGRATQCAVAAAAAIAVTFSTENVDRDWGWTVLGRVFAATESAGPMRYGRNPYDPRLFLIRALFRDIESREPRHDSASRLLRMAVDPNPNVSESALVGLLRLGEIAPNLTWLAAVLATELFGFHARSYDEDEYEHDRFQKREEERVQRQERHRVDAAQRALDRLQNQEEASLQGPPPPWVKVARRRVRIVQQDEEQWSRPSFDFNHQNAAKIVRFFPVEAWCSTPARKDAVFAYLDALVQWTTERLHPSWSDPDTWERQTSHMHEWLEALGNLLARAVPFLSGDEFIERFIGKFCDTSHKSAFEVIASLSSGVVCRHVHDAPTIVPSALVVLEHCATCMLDTPSFDPHSYRGGEVTDYRFQKMIKSLLLVSVDKAPSAARFANGDWSDLPKYMQIVDSLMSRAGWCPYVMEQYLTLCERSGSKIGIEPFSSQVGASLDVLRLKPRLWVGTLIPARISGIVQLLADHNRPLSQVDSGRLLLLLDQLIDLGDRRASALEQSEYFRGVQDA